MTQTILIVEDEQRIAHWVKSYFEKAGYNALAAEDGIKGLDLALGRQPDLVILDLMLPGMDGLDVCRGIRKYSNVPIIMLTAKGTELDRILGLELGADDYIVKPFSLDELVARAKAVLRRTATEYDVPAEDELVISVGEIKLNPDAYICTVRDEPVDLSRIQFALLEALMRNKGRVLSRQQLLDAAFSGDYDGFERTIDVHIRRLRRRIEKDPSNPDYITTAFGIGYKFSDVS